MRFFVRKTGFTLVELIVVISVIAVLASLVIGLGKHVKDQGNIKLTQSTIDILITAVELYYQDEGEMPFITRVEVPSGSGTFVPAFITDPFLVTRFESLLGGPIAFNTANDHTAPATYGDALGDTSDWSSEALYYYLSKSFNSRRIVNAINASLVSSLDNLGVSLNIDVGAGAIEDDIDMLRFVDAWGNALRYGYTEDAAFCLISSPGKDKKYGTNDDITNKK